MKSKKITILSYYDWAGSGYRLYQAISKHTNHDVKFFSEKYDVVFNHPHNTNYISDDLAGVQDRIDESDIVHIKGDTPAEFLENNTGLIVSHKPIVQTVSGSHFRKKEYGGAGTFAPDMYDRCALRTSFEPDLLYPEYKGILTPLAIDSSDKPNLWKKQDPLMFSHFPSNPGVKGTKFIFEVFKKLSDKMKFRIITSKQIVDFDVAMKHKLTSSVYFDQFMVGAYGNATVEMLQYGIPVACWLNHDTNNPIITTDLEVDKWVDLLSDLGDLEKISKESKKYCDETHSFEAVAKQWDELYKNIS